METEGYRYAYDTQDPVEIMRTDMISNCPDFILTEAFFMDPEQIKLHTF